MTRRNYCRAYRLGDLRRFPGWTSIAEPASDSDTAEDACVYVHDTYAVTRGVYQDENVIVPSATPEWIEYCRETLQFAIPDFAPGPPQRAEHAPR